MHIIIRSCKPRIHNDCAIRYTLILCTCTQPILVGTVHSVHLYLHAEIHGYSMQAGDFIILATCTHHAWCHGATSACSTYLPTDITQFIYGIHIMSRPDGSCIPPGGPVPMKLHAGSTTDSVMSTMLPQVSPSSLLSIVRTSLLFRQKARMILPVDASSTAAGFPA